MEGDGEVRPVWLLGRQCGPRTHDNPGPVPRRSNPALGFHRQRVLARAPPDIPDGRHLPQAGMVAHGGGCGLPLRRCPAHHSRRVAQYVEKGSLSYAVKAAPHRIPVKAVATSSPYTSSIVTRSPTIAAARCRLPRVMSFFGSRIRSTWERLVLSSAAILFLEIFFFFMASARCHATTSLTACACASSKMPSSLRKSSRLDPICFLLIAPTPSGAFAPLSSPCPNGLRKSRQQFQCFVPSHTRIGNALPIHQRFSRDQLLRS